LKDLMGYLKVLLTSRGAVDVYLMILVVFGLLLLFEVL